MSFIIAVDSSLRVLSCPPQYRDTGVAILDVDRNLLDSDQMFEATFLGKYKAVCKTTQTFSDMGVYEVEIVTLADFDINKIIANVSVENVPVVLYKEGEEIFRNTLANFPDEINPVFMSVGFEMMEMFEYGDMSYRVVEQVLENLCIRRFYKWLKPNINRSELYRILERTTKPVTLASLGIFHLQKVNTDYSYDYGTDCLEELRTLIVKEFGSPVYYDGLNFYVICESNTDQTKQKIERICLDSANGVLNYSIKSGVVLVENNNYEECLSLLHSRMQVNKRSLVQVHDSFTLESLKQMLHEVTPETESHCRKLASLAVLLGEKMGCTEQELAYLSLGAYLHDIGKIAIRSEILNKPGKLSLDEYEEMKRHSAKGHAIISKFKGLDEVARIIRNHHEKYDGTGYPDNLAGEEIPKLVRIVTVVDSFDAMLSVRCYKDSFPLEHAISELKLCSGTQFCPVTVKNMLELIDSGKIDFLSDYMEEERR